MDVSRMDPWLQPRNGLVPVSAKAVYRLADVSLGLASTNLSENGH